MKYDGLTDEEVVKLQEKYGKNIIEQQKETVFHKLLKTIKEPMFILLLITAFVYFILGNKVDGLIMIICVFSMIGLDFIEEYKTDKTLEKLENLTKSKIVVVRNKMRVRIDSSELVPGDMMVVYEGTRIPADGFIIKCNNLKVDESVLTGESQTVYKTSEKYTGKKKYRPDYCYKGTMVMQGSGIIIVEKTGKNTEYGAIANNIKNIEEEDNNLKKEVNRLTKWITIYAFILFILVCSLNYINLSDLTLKRRIIDSLLSGITLAMSMIPEEIPVILVVFLSLGAYRITKKNALIRNLSSTETLGEISVLCVDKTGTITTNNMEIADIESNYTENEVLENLCLCSVENSNDSMEKAIFDYAQYLGININSLFKNKKIKEYPFRNNMIGTAYHIKDDYVITFKGAFESITKLCKLSPEKGKKLKKNVVAMQKRGFRVIALAGGKFPTIRDVKDTAEEYDLDFMGIIGFIDPPRKEVAQNIKLCKKAGIKIVMITGDDEITASSIGEIVGMGKNLKIVTGEELDNMFDEDLDKIILKIDIFSRVTPQHKFRIIDSFQRNGISVAMTGDGVNDAPALKKANIGIAMGKTGSDISKEASDLILLDDNFNTIVETIRDGRRIYDNIKRAVEYIIIIHVPIAFSALAATLLKIPINNLLFLPIHIVLLEFLIDPTSSIILERMPAEDDIMTRKPRGSKDKLISKNNLLKCLLQGIMIFIVTFGTYYYLLEKDALLARTMGFSIIVLSNIFLIIENYSTNNNMFKTIAKLLKDKSLLLALILIMSISYVLIYTPVNRVANFTKLDPINLLYVFILSFVGVFWYEIVKLIKKHKKTR